MEKNRVQCYFFKLIYLKIVKRLFCLKISREWRKGIVVPMLVLIGGVAHGQGVDFRDLSLDEALAQAAKEKKHVFVDCYTQYCGPCKYMNKNVFPVEKVGDCLNSRFVCVKYDFSGAKHRDLIAKYGVRGYPTILILRPDGTVLQKIVGNRKSDELIEAVTRAMKKNCSLSYLEGVQAKGEMSKKELLYYAMALKEACDDRRTEVQEKLLSCLTDREKVKAKYWIVFEDKWFGNENYRFVVANLGTFQKNVGKEVVDLFIQKRYDKLINSYLVHLQNGSQNDFDESLKMVSSINGELAGIDIGEKEAIAGRLSLLTAYMSNDIKETVERMGELLASGEECQRMVFFLMSIMKRRNNKELMAEVVRAKDYLLSRSSEPSKTRLTNEIDDLKKRV